MLTKEQVEEIITSSCSPYESRNNIICQIRNIVVPKTGASDIFLLCYPSEAVGHGGSSSTLLYELDEFIRIFPAGERNDPTRVGEREGVMPQGSPGVTKVRTLPGFSTADVW